MQILQKKEAVKIGWELTKKNLGFAIIVYAVYLGITLGISGLQVLFEQNIGKGLLSFNITLLEYLVTPLLLMGFFKIFFQLYDGEKAELSTLFKTYEKYVDFLICHVLVTLIIIGGVLLLIVPGVVWALKYQFAIYLVLDRGMKPLEAIKMSGKITHGHKVNLFLFWWVVLGLCILGLMCCFIGIVPAMIAAMFAYIHIYRTLLSDFEKNSSENPVNPVSSFASMEGPISENRPAEEQSKPSENPQTPV
ncbi:MAG: hypothetical protein WCK36_00310 [Candidatus Firestonebacteria bacterium]